MLRINTWAPLQQVESADLNDWQDKTRGALPASDNNDLASTDVLGGDLRTWQSAGSLADATLVLLDDSVNWKDRLVTGQFWRITANQRMGQSADTDLNLTSASGPAITSFRGYTGTGAYSSTAATTAGSNGVPPVNGVGAVRSYAIVADDLGASGNVWLYADPTSGALYLYNASGAAIYGILTAEAPSDTGKR